MLQIAQYLRSLKNELVLPTTVALSSSKMGSDTIINDNKKIEKFLVLVMFFCAWSLVFEPVTYASTNISGDVSGIWDVSGSPYIIIADVNVPTGEQLTIYPGVEVRFDGHYKFLVHGTLTAEGSPDSYVVFTRNRDTNDSRGWGIRFNSSNNPNRLSYCIVEYGYADNGLWDSSLDDRGGGIEILNSAVTIEDCIIRNNTATTGGGIYIGSYYPDPFISNVTIRRNIIKDNIAFNHGYIGCGGGGITVESSEVLIENNIITGNSYSGNDANYEGGGGISLRDNYLITVINNTIFGNSSPKGSGIHTSEGYAGLIQNNIIWGNEGSINGEQVSIETGYEPGPVPEGLDIQYNDIQSPGIVVIYRNNFQDTFSGVNNIDLDPLFVDVESNDFHLQENSPAIDAAVSMNAPDHDFDGNERPQGGGYDIGAYEKTLGNDCKHANYSIQKQILTIPFIRIPVIDFLTGQSTGEVELWTGNLKQVSGTTNRFRLQNNTIAPVTGNPSCPANYIVNTSTLTIPYIDIPVGVMIGNGKFENSTAVFKATLTWEPLGKSFVVQKVEQLP